GDPWDDAAVDNSHRPFEHAPDDALLPPDIARPQLAVGVQTGKFGARPSPARRPVVRPSGAQDEVSPVVARVVRRAGDLDMVDFRPVGPGHTLAGEGLSQPQ